MVSFPLCCRQSAGALAARAAARDLPCSCGGRNQSGACLCANYSLSGGWRHAQRPGRGCGGNGGGVAAGISDAYQGKSCTGHDHLYVWPSSCRFPTFPLCLALYALRLPETTLLIAPSSGLLPSGARARWSLYRDICRACGKNGEGTDGLYGSWNHHVALQPDLSSRTDTRAPIKPLAYQAASSSPLAGVLAVAPVVGEDCHTLH